MSDLQENEKRDLTLPVVAGLVALLALAMLGTVWYARRTAIHLPSTMQRGEIAGARSLTDLQGRPVELFGGSDERVLLCFFSLSCSGCLEEAKVWRALVKARPRRHVRTFVVTADFSLEDIRRYVRLYDLDDLPVLYDPQGRVSAHFKVQMVPQYLLFDPRGKLIDRFTGDSERQGLTAEEMVKAILGDDIAAGSVEVGERSSRSERAIAQ